MLRRSHGRTALTRWQFYNISTLGFEFSESLAKCQPEVMNSDESGVDALKSALAAGGETIVDREAALLTLTAADLEDVLHAQIDGNAVALVSGIGASPGAAVGRVYFNAEDALAAADRGEAVVLVRNETTPADVHGMMAAEGLLTTTGGVASHAAIVARGWGTPAVVGVEAIRIGDGSFQVGDIVVVEGDVISIDGSTGEVFVGERKVAAAALPDELSTILGWADEVRSGHLGVRANADTGVDARRAREMGADGIGLCRTEHMFLAPDRLPVMRQMILAQTSDEESAALEELGRVQQVDFVEVLEAMDGLPVTVRLLDPPLHEFLPSVLELEVQAAIGQLTEFEQRELDAARDWAEHNPMIGTRGVRLAVLKPGLYAMQVKALLAAVRFLRERGADPVVEIMIPLTVSHHEMALARSWVQREIEEADLTAQQRANITIGTMIETPRAAVLAGKIADEADFFSFGTNDLTQLVYGFSRDDVERRLLPAYLEQGLLDKNPFVSIDPDGVGELVRMGVQRGRENKPGLQLGVCGEHGGDPGSIDFFVSVGLDYVSCSPFRVPIARLAAAQAVLRRRSGQTSGTMKTC